MKLARIEAAREYGNPAPRLSPDGIAPASGSPTRHQVKTSLSARWMRVYFSNADGVDRHFIIYRGDRIPVDSSTIPGMQA